ncbi:hypothetical protein [Zavarzinella formosa]|uniref:hypothetical protein n=1 Tax=Zavarzinella formosa TaxID=360055 RepID=UPI00030F00C5|nr:hypothetical protein [Zavarzinella formosa]
MSVRGRNIPLTPARRLIGDLMCATRGVPCIVMERRMHLGQLVAARQNHPTRVGWCAIFTKAFGLVSAQRPELRRAFLSYPRSHLYEHNRSIASVAVERRLGNEEAVLFALFQGPEERSLVTLQTDMDRAKNAPVEENGAFRRELRLSRLPSPLRRLIWWYTFKVCGKRRAKHCGTFGISATASLGASQLMLLSPLTTTLYYGPFDKEGAIDVRLVFDHRVVDGANIARIMVELEGILCQEILTELAAGAASSKIAA